MVERKKVKTYKTAAGAQQYGDKDAWNKLTERALSDFRSMSQEGFKKKYGKKMFESMRRINAGKNAAGAKAARDKGQKGLADLNERFEKGDVEMAKEYKKRGMSKGGMAKGYNKGGYANCGASMPPSKKR